jgi:Ras-related protein Rab-28
MNSYPVDEDEEERTHYQFKVVVLGDGTVGKTSLCLRCSQNEHNKQYKQTIGVDFYIKQLTLPGGINVAMQLWDIGGQTLGGKMVTNYIFGCQAVLLVYDITNYQSFLDLDDWLALIKREIPPDRYPYIAILANKSDLAHLRAVHASKHNAFAAEHRMYSYQVSASTGDGVAASMYRIAADLAGVPLSNADVEHLLGVVRTNLHVMPAYIKAGSGIGSYRAYTPSPEPSIPSKPQSPVPLLGGGTRSKSCCNQHMTGWCCGLSMCKCCKK